MCGCTKHSEPYPFRQLEQRYECRSVVCEREQQLDEREQECFGSFLTFINKLQNMFSKENVAASNNREYYPRGIAFKVLYENTIEQILKYLLGMRNSICFSFGGGV